MLQAAVLLTVLTTYSSGAQSQFSMPMPTLSDCKHTADNMSKALKPIKNGVVEVSCKVKDFVKGTETNYIVATY